MTLHIRGVGQWTNRLYDYYENEKNNENNETRKTMRQSRKTQKPRKTSLEKILGHLPQTGQNQTGKNQMGQNGPAVVKYGDGQDRFDLVISDEDRANLPPTNTHMAIGK